MPEEKKFSVRFAKEEDVPSIFAMIRELAAYEKLLDKFEATEKGLKESIFKRHVVEALIAEQGGKPVGYALFFQNFSSFLGRAGFFIEDIYVKPEFRGSGLGQQLFAFIARLAVGRGCGRLEWACLDWNEPSIAFYRKLGAVPLSEWTMYKLSGKELQKLSEEPREV